MPLTRCQPELDRTAHQAGEGLLIEVWGKETKTKLRRNMQKTVENFTIDKRGFTCVKDEQDAIQI